MSGPLAPVIPSSARRHHVPATLVGRPPLPMAELPLPLRVSDAVYGMATVGERGQMADQIIMRSLGWRPSGSGGPGTRLVIGERAGLVVVAADPAGIFGLTAQGHLRLPAAVRRRCRIEAGDWVLLVAEPALHRLVVHPAAHLDAMVERRHAELLSSECR